MSQAIIQDQQNLYDLAVEQYGSADAVFKLIADNGGTLDAALTPGETLEIRDNEINNQNNTEVIRRKPNYRPATGDIPDALGIGQMGIEFTFIVS